MSRTQRILATLLVLPAICALVGAAAASPTANQQDGQRLLGANIQANGQYVIDKKGDNTVSVEVINGKVAGLRLMHAIKGNVPVKKYKSTQKMAKLQADGLQNASFNLDQSSYLGMVYIGYAFTDESREEYIYWFPDHLILDGEMGAIEYIPAS